MDNFPIESQETLMAHGQRFGSIKKFSKAFLIFLRKRAESPVVRWIGKNQRCRQIRVAIRFSYRVRCGGGTERVAPAGSIEIRESLRTN